MKRVLQELPSLDGGGIAKLLYEYYSQMEHDKIHFDFIIYSYYDEGIYEKPLREMGYIYINYRYINLIPKSVQKKWKIL